MLVHAELSLALFVIIMGLMIAISIQSHEANSMSREEINQVVSIVD